jgi:hypothetical protein
MADPRLQKRTARLSLAISIVLHTVVLGALFFFAAREGMLGKQLKKIAVTMVPKEKPPEKPKEKPVEPKPLAEPSKSETPKLAAAPQAPAASATVTPPPPTVSAPLAAPPPAALPAFDFEGGKAVETTSNPNILYKGFVEYTLRSHWHRPEGIADQDYVAEAEVSIDASGLLAHTEWKKGSGDPAWDNSVKKVLAETKSIGRPPPKGFPEKVRVRFEVQVTQEIGLE